MFPSTPKSNSTFKGFSRSNGLAEHHLTRPRTPLAERIQRRINQLQGRNGNESRSKNKCTERGSLVTPSPSKFGRERMVRARCGLFRRLSLERACLSARGEDAIACVSVPSGLPLQSSSGHSLGLWEGSSHLGCSSASGLAGHVNLNSSGTSSSLINVNAEHSPPRTLRTLVENNLPNIQTPVSMTMSPQLNSPDASVNTRKNSLYDYFLLQFEAETALLESKKQWVDTPYSVSVVQDFEPPYDAEMIQSVLQESLNNYKPLPSQLLRRPRTGSRISCRMSPYANSRRSRLMSPQNTSPPSPSLKRSRNAIIPKANPPLSGVLSNCSTPALTKKSKSILRPAMVDIQSAPLGTPLRTKSRRTPTAEQTIFASGSEKPAKNKEILFQDPPKTPGGSLRVDRPLPRYRTPTPGRKRRPAKE